MLDKDTRNSEEVWHTEVRGSQVTEVPTVNYDIYTDDEVLEELHGPRSWIGPALASAIFCFLPTGLVAFYHAHKAQKSFQSGDFHTWSRYTARARFFVFVTCILGIFVYLAVIAAVQAVKHTDNGT